MISLILGIIILVKISNYKKNRRFADAKSAGSLGTANLVFTILQLIPVIVFGLFMLGAMGEMIEEANGDIDEIIITFIAGGIMLAPSIALTAFGFVTSSKGRKLWKSVNTYGSADYVPVSERNNGYNQNRYAQNQTSYNYSYGSSNNSNVFSGNNNSGFYNSSGLYGDAARQNNTAGTQSVTAPIENTQSFSTPTASADNCDYGRSENGYIPHPESADEHCETHSFTSYGNKKWKCPSCGKNNKAEESFCRNCGTNRTATF